MRQQGFSLLEILVAFSILALSLGVLMQIFSGATRNADLTRNQTRATALAQSLIAGTSAESTLAAGENRGTTDDGFRWHIEVAPFDDSSSAEGAASTPTAVASLDLWRIAVQVAWEGGAGLNERSVSLATLRTRPRPTP